MKSAMPNAMPDAMPNAMPRALAGTINDCSLTPLSRLHLPLLAALDDSHQRRAWLELMLDEQRQGLAWPFVARAPDGTLVGTCSLQLSGERAVEAWLGYWIAPPYRRRGLGGVAVRQLIELGFGKLGLGMLQAEVWADNLPSLRLLIKLGFATTQRCSHSTGDLLKLRLRREHAEG